MRLDFLTTLGAPVLLIIGGLGIVSLFYIVHRSLDRICITHEKRYCHAHAIEISHWRMSPALDQRGTKTEKTQIEILTTGDSDQRKVYRFIVWAFGITRIAKRCLSSLINQLISPIIRSKRRRFSSATASLVFLMFS
jgi:hypothetical protein